jgi:hypothetical protein
MTRRSLTIAAGILAATLTPALFAAGDDPAKAPTVAPTPSCGDGMPGGVHCTTSKEEFKLARNEYKQGVKLQTDQRLEEAFDRYDEAARLAPRNMQFLTARELVKAQLVFNHVEKGNALMRENARAGAVAEFRAALALDAQNQYAQERLEEATLELAPVLPRALTVGLPDSGEIHLEPREARATFHYTGDVNGLFAELSAAFGVTVQFDDSVQARQVRFNVDDVDFFTALHLACQVSKTMWSPMGAHHFLVAKDSPENHKQYDRMSLRTFILPAHSTPTEVSDIVNTMKSIFDLHFVSSGQAADTLEVRGPQPVLEACAKLMEQFGHEKPQVALTVQVYQIDHQLMRNIGTHIPDTFNMYNIPAAALLALGGQSISQLVNQLIASGGINQAGSSAISGLLAQLSGSGSGNSIFSQPLATFGGGLTFSGVSLDQFAANLSVNESWVRSLENVTLRAGQGADAKLHLGERYPIQNASYAPISNSPQISAVLGNQSYVPPFPSVSYEDLGLNLTAKPTIHGDGSVSVDIELQVRSLTGESDNNIPVISNKEYKGSIHLADGEPVVVAGQVSLTDTRSMAGIPGLGYVPFVNLAMVDNTRELDTDELMIVITPHVLANFVRSSPTISISER